MSEPSRQEGELRLLAMWLCARILIASSAWWPAAVVVIIDMAFLVMLAALVAPPLLRERSRNTPLLLVLVLLAACNGVFHWALIRHDPGMASHAILIGIDIALLLVHGRAASRWRRSVWAPPNFYGVQDLHGLIWEWVEDFGTLMVSGDSRAQGDPDKLAYCGAGALSEQDRENYPILMRLAFLSSLEARSTARSLGFRCAADATP